MQVVVCGKVGFFSHISRMVLGGAGLDEGSIREALDHVRCCLNRRDFIIAGLIRRVHLPRRAGV